MGPKRTVAWSPAHYIHQYRFIDHLSDPACRCSPLRDSLFTSTRPVPGRRLVGGVRVSNLSLKHPHFRRSSQHDLGERVSEPPTPCRGRRNAHNCLERSLSSLSRRSLSECQWPGKKRNWCDAKLRAPNKCIRFDAGYRGARYGTDEKKEQIPARHQWARPPQ